MNVCFFSLVHVRARKTPMLYFTLLRTVRRTRKMKCVKVWTVTVCGKVFKIKVWCSVSRPRTTSRNDWSPFLKFCERSRFRSFADAHTQKRHQRLFPSSPRNTSLYLTFLGIKQQKVKWNSTIHWRTHFTFYSEGPRLYTVRTFHLPSHRKPYFTIINERCIVKERSKSISLLSWSSAVSAKPALTPTVDQSVVAYRGFIERIHTNEMKLYANITRQTGSQAEDPENFILKNK